MTDFKDLGVQDRIAKAIEEMGWNEPTPIQTAAVPEGLNGRDIFAQAQTGTGKTGTYAMIVMGRVTSGSKKPSVLILAPTRELANQIDLEFSKLSRYSHHRSIAIYGGASINDQMYKLRKGADIIVGTPGRVKDMIERGCLDLSVVTEVVLDEADRMLDMGFSDELNFIMDKVPQDRQTLLFSATMDKEIKRLSMRYMIDPKEILVSRDEPCSDLTAQYYVPVSRKGKRECLQKIVENGNPKIIVFCQTKKMVDELFEDLSKAYKAGAIHGDMPQNKREKVIRNFRNDKFQILVATDVAARGLDVNNIDCVVNYDIPNDPETYLHRIGRTGRAGKEGMAISFVTKREDNCIRMYERSTGKKITKMHLDDMVPMETKQRSSSVEARPVYRSEPRQFEPVEARPAHRPEPRQYESVEPRSGYKPEIIECESVETRPRYKSETHSRTSSEERPAVKKVKTVKPTTNRNDMIVLKLNVGRDDGFGRTQITEFVKQHTELDNEHIGRIGLGGSSSYFEVKGDYVEYAIESLSGQKHKQKKVFAQIAPQKAPYPERSKKKAKPVTT
jgi:Superfamily II DNA and RNA helicases